MTYENSFETALNELELVVKKLENGEITLDETIELYERGMKLSAECANKLENAKQKIISLTEAEKQER